jgi:hypothetical protein
LIEKNAFMVLKYSLLTARVRLSGCPRDCAAGRKFKFHKSRQLFMGAGTMNRFASSQVFPAFATD